MSLGEQIPLSLRSNYEREWQTKDKEMGLG